MLAGSLGGAGNVKQKRREAQCALNLAAKLAPLLVDVGSLSNPAARGKREGEYMDEVEQVRFPVDFPLTFYRFSIVFDYFSTDFGLF